MEKKMLAGIIIIGIAAAAFIGWTAFGLIAGEELLEEEDEVDIAVGGSTTCFPMILFCAQEFSDDNEEYDISVAGVGSKLGVQGVINNIYDIGMSSSDPAKYDPTGITTYRPFAHDAVIMSMSAGNEHFTGGLVPALTMEQIRKIYNGTYSTWADLAAENSEFQDSGNADPIVVVGRDANSGTRETFEKLTHVEESDAPYFSSGAGYDYELPSNGAVQALLQSNPHAIGYVGIAYMSGLDGMDVAAEGDPIGSAVTPDVANIKSHDYPLTRYLYILYKGTLRDDVQDFYDYVFSTGGQIAVDKAGGVPL